MPSPHVEPIELELSDPPLNEAPALGGVLPGDEDWAALPDDRDGLNWQDWIGAVLLHLLVVLLLVLAWAGFFSSPVPVPPKAIPVTMVTEPPPPPKPPPQEAAKPEPKPQPTPQPQPQPEQQKPPEITPRMSGEDEKTEAQKTAENKPALPQPRPAPEKPQPKRQPVKSGEAQTAMGSSDMTPVAPQGDLAPAARQPPVEGDTIHYVRFSPETGGTGDHDMAGDPYLNAIKARVEHYRQYPPASEFPPIGKEVVIISILVEPTGQISQIKVLDPPTSDRVTEAARMMINLSSPFPPLPSSWGNYRTSIEAEFLMVPSGTETR